MSSSAIVPPAGFAQPRSLAPESIGAARTLRRGGATFDVFSWSPRVVPPGAFSTLASCVDSLAPSPRSPLPFHPCVGELANDGRVAPLPPHVSPHARCEAKVLRVYRLGRGRHSRSHW